jgi:hypothetical protein
MSSLYVTCDTEDIMDDVYPGSWQVLNLEYKIIIMCLL